MSKEFLLIAYGSQSEDNKLNLLETSALFERTLTGLKSGDEVLGLPGTNVAPIRDQLQIVESLWKKFKPLIEHATAGAAITDDQCAVLAETNVPLLKQMNKVVGMFEAEAT